MSADSRRGINGNLSTIRRLFSALLHLLVFIEVAFSKSITVPSFDAVESTSSALTPAANVATASPPSVQMVTTPTAPAAAAVASSTPATVAGTGTMDTAAQLAALQQQILQMQAAMAANSNGKTATTITNPPKSSVTAIVKPPESALAASAAAVPIGNAGMTRVAAQQMVQQPPPPTTTSFPATSQSQINPLQVQQQRPVASIHVGSRAYTPNDISPQFAATEEERVQRIQSLSIDEGEDEITPGFNLDDKSISSRSSTNNAIARGSEITTATAPRSPVGMVKVDSHVSETADSSEEEVINTNLVVDKTQPQKASGDQVEESSDKSTESPGYPASIDEQSMRARSGSSISSSSSTTGNLRGTYLTTSSTTAQPIELEGGIIIGPKSMGAFVDSVQNCGESTKIVFLGDTTLAKLRQQPAAMDLLNAYGSVNLAIEGYTVEQMDEFLRKVELHNIAHTHSVVVMIGAENLGAQEKADSVYEKIVAFVETVRQRFDTGTKLYLLTILPRDSPGLNRAITSVNKRLHSKFKAYGMVKVIDLTANFFDAAKGTLITSLYSGNNYHINKEGYTVIMELLLSMFGDVPKLATGESPICDMSILDTFAVSPSTKKDDIDLASDEATPEAIAAVKASAGALGSPVSVNTAGFPTAQPTGGLIKLTTRVNPDRPDGTSIKPVLHKRHAEFEPEILGNLATFSEKTKLMLFGDSVFHKFGNANLMPEYAPVNLASPSFQTEHVIMRISNLNLLPMRKVPVVALMVGGFNIGSRDSPEEVFQGILGVIKELKITFSRHTKIFVFSILPRNSLKLNNDIRSVNSALVAASDMPNSGFNFVDLTNRFVDENTLAIEERMFEADKFTPSSEAMNLIKDVLVSAIEEAIAEAAATASPTPAPTEAPSEQGSTDSSSSSELQSPTNQGMEVPSDAASLHHHNDHDHNQPEGDRERPSENVISEPGVENGEEVVGGRVVKGKIRHKLTTIQYLKYQALKYMPFLKGFLENPTSHKTIVSTNPSSPAH